MPEEDKSTENKEQETETSDRDGATGEPNGREQEHEDVSDSGDDNESVVLSKKEHGTLVKKARDFDRIVAGQNLGKFMKKRKDTPKDDVDKQNPDDKLSAEQIAKIAAEAARDAIRQEREPMYKENLGKALKSFVEDHPWADSDKIVDRITESFDAGDAFTPEALRVKINRAAEEAFPEQYEKANIDRYRNRAAAERKTAEDGSAGDGGAGTVPNDATGDGLPANITKEDRDAADKFFGGDLKKYFKYKD